MTQLRRFAALALLFVAPAAMSQSENQVFVDRVNLDSVVIDEPSSVWPGSGFRTGQEAWVRLHFVVTPDGRAVDPIVVDSVGGAAFEQAAVESLDDYRFEPAASENPDVVFDIRFELRRGREAATANFLRRSRRIMSHVFDEDVELARQQVDAAVRLGGWNLYEEAMLALMVGRVEGLEGDVDGKLAHYQRATRFATRNALDGEDRQDALSRIFEMQHSLGQYGSAMETLARLRAEPASDESEEALQPLVDEINAAFASAAPITARGRLFTPCNCDEGEAIWRYRPLRSEFSFANVDGNVESFEARCEASRISGDVETGGHWTLPEEPARCEIFVFGADGANFEILEHASDEKTARNLGDDGLDRANGI